MLKLSVDFLTLPSRVSLLSFSVAVIMVIVFICTQDMSTEQRSTQVPLESGAGLELPPGRGRNC